MTTAFPFDTASQGWSQFATSADNLASELNPEVLLGGISGGPFDAIITDLNRIRGATTATALAAADLSSDCATQHLYDAALAQAPTVSEVREAETAAERVVQRRRAGGNPRQGDQAIQNRAQMLREERDEAVERHRQDTSRTTLTEPPVSTIPGTGITPRGPGFAPVGAESEPPFGDEGSPVGTDLSSDSGQQAGLPAPTMNPSTQTPQQTGPSAAPGFTPTMANTSPSAYTPRKTDRDSGVRDLPGRGEDVDADDPEPGTDLSTDRGGVSHGTTLSDTSGRPRTPVYGPITAASGVSTASTGYGGYGSGGMMPMGGMGGAGQRGGDSRQGNRPQVLSDDPEGRRGDEFAFEGGLVSKENPEEEAFLAWVSAEDRAVIEARENPHVVGQRV